MNQMVFQMQIAKKQDAVPLTRDYMVDAENGTQVTPCARGRGARRWRRSDAKPRRD